MVAGGPDIKEYLLLFRSSTKGSPKPSAEQIQERKTWFGEVVSQGRLADKGNTLSPVSAKTIAADGSIKEGAYAANNEIVSGYLAVKADSIDEAILLARTNPVFKVGGSIEVREIVTFISGT